jgi:hypothetical protein
MVYTSVQTVEKAIILKNSFNNYSLLLSEIINKTHKIQAMYALDGFIIRNNPHMNEVIRMLKDVEKISKNRNTIIDIISNQDGW